MNDNKRRRLEPLRLDADAEMPAALPPSTVSSSVQGGSRFGRLSPAVKAGVLVLTAVVFLSAGVAGALLLLPPSPSPGPTPTVSSLPSSALAAIPAPPAWTGDLHGERCVAPCCGGAACLVTDENAHGAGCRTGSSTCSPCLSKIDCIPGACGDPFNGTESWLLYLSAIAERGTGSHPVDPCKSKRDLWLCVRSKSNPEAACVSQIDACNRGVRSTRAIPITSSTMITEGFDLEVRLNGSDGPIIAAKLGARYPDGIQRAALCNGLKVTFPSAESIAYITYFLDIPAL